ncbi:MAG: coproporphyrinogen dehydrogenase HemZ [Clostridiales bacterium]|nr:coproporphyrinogen dehydrogenase HemZ [Clostridiales bacterium]
MITIALNEANFEYDIHSLVKAFYPEHEVAVRAVCETEEESERQKWKLDEFRRQTTQADIHLEVEYREDTIAFFFFQPAGASGLQTDAAVLTGQVSVDPSDRKETKNRLKQKLYEMLTEFSGRMLPWGTLTGIRPTKIPMAMLEEGQPEDEIRTYMRETYFATDEKIDLSIKVAKREMELLSRIDYENGYSLYIGIPFCPTTCLYCSFTSYPISLWKKRVDEYLDALCREIAYTAKRFRGKYLNAVYIGGGTPTSLEPEQLERLITVIGESFGLFDEQKRIVYGGHLLEFTVEAGRPDSITAEKLEVLRRHNISRISINPQTMKEETLQLIGRRHTVEQTRESFALARDMGFDNINMDLIVGLPEENLDDVRRAMAAVADLAPDNVTVHSLAVKRAARLRMERENYTHLHMVNTWETIDLTARCCRDMGLSPYYLYRQKNMAGNFENVGYAAPGKAGVYNILIMEEKQTIMALGAGATTKVVYDHGNRIERVGNVKDLANYLARVDEMIEKKEELLARVGL